MKTIKNLPLLLALFLLPLFSFGQSEKENYKKASAEFEQFFNADEYQKVFDLFSSQMKVALPIEKTTEIVKGIKSQAGTIEKMEFIKYENEGNALYKTTFERIILGVKMSLDEEDKMKLLLFIPYQESYLPTLARNETKLILPFKGEWSVFWGGDTEELNYHVTTPAQKNAFDILITNEEGKTYKTDGKHNEDYYAFGKELIAPADAEVVLVVDGVKDNVPGEMNPIYIPGNTVILKTAANEYLFFAHFKQNSIVVKQGQKVKKGELLGLCGNSGNSSEAHLHFHIQNVEDMTKGTGAKAYFEEIVVNGEVKKDYSPIKGDKIKNN